MIRPATSPAELTQRAARRPQSEPSALADFLKPLASLRLTVVLLALTTILVYVGTSVQKEMGIWDVQRKFFHSFWAWTELRLFFPLWGWGFEKMPGRIPLPGGYTLIVLLLINLLAAHTVRFKMNWKRSGIIMIHAGLILLIIGEVVTATMAREGQMVIDEGQTVSFVQDIREAELAIVDPSPTDHDDVVAIPAARLAKQDTISYPTLPFSVRVDKYYANSVPAGPFQLQQMNVKPDARATVGAGVGTTMIEKPLATGVDTDNVDAPSAYVTVLAGGQDLGTFLVTLWHEEPQEFVFSGKTYTLQLRWKRTYKPYSLTLHDFTHDKYTGTDVPKNFASRVQLLDPTRNENREVKIWMNHPLRYAGETFFQASFKRDDKTTILQVVKNPGWLIPYISCTAISLGLLIHFGMVLTNFLSRTLVTVTAPANSIRDPKSKVGNINDRTPWFAGVLVPGLVAGLCVLVLLSMGKPPRSESPFDYNAFGRVPINYEGRVMPLDTLARVSLRIISNKSEIRLDDGKKLPAINWLADVLGQPERSRGYKIFRIDHPDLLTLLNLDSNRKLFSFAELAPSLQKIDEQMTRIGQVNRKDWDIYQRKMSDLHSHLVLFTRLERGSELYVAPPVQGADDWKTFEQAMRESQNASAEPASLATPPAKMNPGLAAYVALVQSYHADRSDMFNSAARDYVGYLAGALPDLSRRVDFEVLFNYFDPFVTSMYFYVAAFLVMLLGLLFSPARTVFRRSALAIIIVTFIFHTLGLLGRIYIQGRPPVTNLYSSAIFIGWGAVGVSIILELMFKNGIGNLVAPLIAFPTLVIAHYLAGSGDTMQMLQAVLDTNLWLATHVLAVTMGYTATFVAGVLAIVLIVGNIFLARNVDTVFHRAMGKMVYGTLCFALLFSFVGTVLGGIWADQSWGRFWGWDPKENGAVMIVLWNAIVLHARWAGLIRAGGLALLAVVGNVITGWSWFGTNLMGVGLHSYGFMDSGVFWLGLFAASQLLIMGLALARGLIPLNRPATAT